MDRVLDLVALFSVVLAAMVLFSVRRAHIRVEYSVSWLTASLILFAASRSQTLLHFLSHMLGMSSPGLALVALTICVFLVVFYRFSVRISDLKDANIALTQRLAILEYRLNSRNEDQHTQSPAS